MMSAVKRAFTIYTAEGVSFESIGSSLAKALNRAAISREYNVVAVIESECVVTSAVGKLTALIVRHSPSGSIR